MATRADSLPPFIATPPVPTPRLAEFANDNVATDASSPFDTAWRRYASALPTDAFAIIEPDPLAGRSGGRAREGRWRLRFRPRSRPFVDPLTGWTGGSDTLAHLELGFPSREAAEAYCRRYGLYESRGAPRGSGPRPRDEMVFISVGVPTCCMPAGPHPVCCGNATAEPIETSHADT
ncbi:NADH dehydrogenase ubiquinone Fe-S protein 4 [Novosphingobium sp. B1]|jgi:hypothetical protein|uniref:NADH dehydrogenase ubiquinone Fe-S protein 4 n=1 Tax=Novosphingobium sp. B1 TaxID=1938756 RepID=UPI0009D87389|nr:NADH dehydrogenase ubiquinone Fe-S protein 4 [Novosphingobium sp. B1]SMD05828.1 ETC complex I subunit conserved region [Novosphingobium sp. B1]